MSLSKSDLAKIGLQDRVLFCRSSGLKSAHVLDRKARTDNLQGVVHLGKGLLRLREEAKHNRSAEITLIFVIVHLQDLLKRQGIYTVTEIW
jgi:hypothetical protein